MRHRKHICQHDITILLSSLLLFSSVVGIVYGGRKRDKPGLDALSTALDISSDQGSNKLNDISAIDIAYYLNPLLISGSVEKIVETLKGLNEYKVVAVLREVFKRNKSPLDEQDAKELIIGLARNFTLQSDQDLVLHFLLERPAFTKGEPILLVAARGRYRDAIPLLSSWIGRMTNAPQLENGIMNAYLFAINENQVEGMAELVHQKVPLTSQQATQLLREAVANRRDPRFVQLLKSVGADVNDVKDGVTLLIKAVRNNDTDMVRALLDGGANVNLLADDAVGTALQNAIILRHVPIELLLRERGARE